MDKDRVINIAVMVSGIDEEYQSDIIKGINKFHFIFRSFRRYDWQPFI